MVSRAKEGIYNQFECSGPSHPDAGQHFQQKAGEWRIFEANQEALCSSRAFNLWIPLRVGAFDIIFCRNC